MFCVGLTGGIACGKSNALRCFRRLGAHTVDADVIAREVVEPGKTAYRKILAEFGSVILGQGDQINRKELGSIIFSDPTARQKLNDIVHPYVVEEEERISSWSWKNQVQVANRRNRRQSHDRNWDLSRASDDRRSLLPTRHSASSSHIERRDFGNGGQATY